MVQLSTTYDTVLHKKIFMLKGDEAYAKSTDTVMNVVEFSDSYTHMSYMRVGLEIAVHRMIGDISSVIIYCNDEVLKVIPWAEVMSSSVISGDDDLSWDSTKKVVQWGTEDDDDSGLILEYGIDNEFYAKFVGNPQCLKSESKHENWNLPLPEHFESTLTFSGTTSYDGGATTSLSLLFEVDNTLTDSKSVKIYDDDTLKTTISVTKDVASTVALTGLSDGLHTIRAVFEGDDECSFAETTIDISIGYDFTSMTMPSVIVSGVAQSMKLLVEDYFHNAQTSKTITLKQNGSTVTTATTDSEGTVSFSNVTLSDYPLVFTYGGSTGTFTPTFVNPSSITINADTLDVVPNSRITLTGSILDSNNEVIEVSGVPITISRNGSGLTTVNTNYGIYSMVYSGNSVGTTELSATVTGTQVTDSIDVNDYLWAMSSDGLNYSYTAPVLSYCTMEAISNGWAITNTQQTMGQVDFKIDALTKYIIEFDCKGTTNSKYRVMGHILPAIPSGTHVKVEYNVQTHERKYWIDEVLESTQTSTVARRVSIGCSTSNVGDTVRFDNLRILRVND